MCTQVGDGTPVVDNGGTNAAGEQTLEAAWEVGSAILNTGAYDFAGSGVVHMTVRASSMESPCDFYTCTTWQVIIVLTLVE
jgi:hypothetical protein